MHLLIEPYKAGTYCHPISQTRKQRMEQERDCQSAQSWDLTQAVRRPHQIITAPPVYC